jgi:acetyl esterase/lipase
MKNFEKELSSAYGFLKPCKLEGCLHKEPSPSVLIFPGGGYSFVSPREAQPVAARFFEKGYNAFVLTYSTADRALGVHYPMQLFQAVAAILYIRQNKQFLRATDDVIVCGFSAGGHLASMAAVFYDKAEVRHAFSIKGSEARPSAAILCYPVISAIESPHCQSLINLTGKSNPKDYIHCSTELSVDGNTPPAFLWHTANDAVVDVRNSISFAQRLVKFKVPFELHVFEEGAHGLSMCDESTSEGNPALIRSDVGKWFELCITWLDNRFKKS